MYAEELVQVGRALLPTLETVYSRLLRPDAQGRPAATMSGEDLVRWHRLALADVHSAVDQFQHDAFDTLGPRSYGASVHRLDGAISALLASYVASRQTARETGGQTEKALEQLTRANAENVAMWLADAVGYLVRPAPDTPTGRVIPPAAPQTGLGFLGTVAAFALGLGAGDALFGDD